MIQEFIMSSISNVPVRVPTQLGAITSSDQAETSTASKISPEAMAALRQSMAESTSEKGASPSSPQLTLGSADLKDQDAANKLFLQQQDAMDAGSSNFLTEAANVVGVVANIAVMVSSFMQQLNNINNTGSANNTNAAASSAANVLPKNGTMAAGITYAILSPQTLESKNIGQQQSPEQTKAVNKMVAELEKNDAGLQVLGVLSGKLKEVPGDKSANLVMSNISEKDFKQLANTLKNAGTPGADKIGSFKAEQQQDVATGKSTIVMKSDASILVWIAASDALQKSRMDALEEKGKMMIIQGDMSAQQQKAQIQAGIDSMAGSIAGSVVSAGASVGGAMGSVKANSASSASIKDTQGKLGDISQRKLDATARLNAHNELPDNNPFKNAADKAAITDELKGLKLEKVSVNAAHEDVQTSVASRKSKAEVATAAGHLGNTISTTTGEMQSATQRAEATKAETAQQMAKGAQELSEESRKTIQDVIDKFAQLMQQKMDSTAAVQQAVGGAIGH